MKRVISASRRTDLVAFFPEWLGSAIREEKALVRGPSGRVFTASLRPEEVHTFVLWSKDFSNFIRGRSGLGMLPLKYEQVYCHFTMTGLGGTPIEPGAIDWKTGLAELEPLVRLCGSPDRISLRFDPLVYWIEGGEVRSNLHLFPVVAERAVSLGIKNIRTSFAQWYKKAIRRARLQNFSFYDPPVERKLRDAEILAGIARSLGHNLFSCSQTFMTAIPGIHPSSCIDGRVLMDLHPRREAASIKKDGSQRAECGCTESVDIGSYTQSCPHSCVYCYANPRV